ncbi:MAG: tetratricopeptide repeat protein [Planctomycetota bacterium]
MKKQLALGVLMLFVGGCVSIPSRDDIRAKYKVPGPAQEEALKDKEMKDLLLNASVSGKSQAEKQDLFNRFEKAIERCIRERRSLGAAFDLCVTQYRLFPNERKAAINLAIVHASMRKEEGAIALLQGALDKKDEFFEDKGQECLERVHRTLGAHHLARDDAEKAIRHLETALEMNPKDAHACYLLGQSYGLRFRASNAKEDSQKAIERFKKGFEIGPKLALPEDYARYASLLLQAGDHKGAISILKKGIARFPAVPAFYFNLGQYVRAGGDVIGAYYLYTMAALVRSPGDTHAKLAVDEMSKIQAAASETKDDKQYEQIRQIVRAAELTGQEGKEAEAAEALRKALDANGKNEFTIRYLLGKALVDAKKWSEAAPLLEGCIKERPWFAPAYVEVGRMCESQGNRPEAMKVWVRAMEIQPQNWRVQEIWDRVTDEARKKALDKLKEPAPPQ